MEGREIFPERIPPAARLFEADPSEVCAPNVNTPTESSSLMRRAEKMGFFGILSLTVSVMMSLFIDCPYGTNVGSIFNLFIVST